MYRAWHGCCSLLGFFEVDFIFEGAVHSCYHELTINPCNVDRGLVDFAFDPHFVELNFGF